MNELKILYKEAMERLEWLESIHGIKIIYG